jgi:regulator of RNase E activity RraA
MVHRGVAGLVVDGAVRDAEEFRALDFPVIARGATPRSGTTAAGWGEVNVPVACGGVVVGPGDIVVGDGEGLVVVPAGWAGAVAAALGKTGHSAYEPAAIRTRLAALTADSPLPNLGTLKAALAERGGVVIDGCFGEDGPLGSL